MEWIITTVILIIILILSLVLWIVFSNLSLKTTNYAIKSDKLPKSFDGFKVAHVSDFHNEKRLGEKLAKAIKTSAPDVIVITGDLIDSRRTRLDTAVDFLGQIINVAPTYYVTGNHEARSKDFIILEKEMQKLGVRVLRNQKEEIVRNGDKIVIAGADDPQFDKTTTNKAYVMEKTLQTLDLSDNDFNALLSHRPELFDVYASSNASAVFCGHAHGGQFRIFGRGLYAPNQGVLPKYTSSVHEKNGTFMIVSRGIGNSAFPFRFNNRPELVTVILFTDEK